MAIAFLLHRSIAPDNVKKGVISVDYIQPVRHEPVVNPHPLAGHEKKPTFRKPEPEPPPPQAPVGVPDATASVTNEYIFSILKIINQRKVYPAEAVDRGEEGRVVVGVSVGADGQILDTRIEEPCPFARLNASALQTVEKIRAFPPLPAGIPAPIHLHIPLVYRVESK